MTVLRERRLFRPYIYAPKVALRLRLLRDGEVTAAPKTVRVYLDWDSAAKVEMVFHAEAGEGEWSRPFIVDLATLLAQGEWLFCGVDNTAPRRTHASYLSPTASGDITFNITEPFDRHTLDGLGLFAGSFPLSMITQEGNLPSQAEIRILYRPNTGDPGDGILVSTTTCNADGTWQVSGLDENFKFDIVARIPGFNDVLISNVQPVSASPSP